MFLRMVSNGVNGRHTGGLLYRCLVPDLVPPTKELYRQCTEVSSIYPSLHAVFTCVADIYVLEYSLPVYNFRR